MKSSGSRLLLRHPCRDENFSQLLPVSTGTSKAEITVTASIAMIFGPALPLLHLWPVTKTCCCWKNYQRWNMAKPTAATQWNIEQVCNGHVTIFVWKWFPCPEYSNLHLEGFVLVSTFFRGERIHFAGSLLSHRINSTCQKVRGETGKTEGTDGSFSEVMFCLQKKTWFFWQKMCLLLFSMVVLFESFESFWCVPQITDVL